MGIFSACFKIGYMIISRITVNRTERHHVLKAKAKGIYEKSKIKCSIFRNNSSGIFVSQRTAKIPEAATI